MINYGTFLADKTWPLHLFKAGTFFVGIRGVRERCSAWVGVLERGGGGTVLHQLL